MTTHEKRVKYNAQSSGARGIHRRITGSDRGATKMDSRLSNLINLQILC
jgi:hypothetical protein